MSQTESFAAEPGPAKQAVRIIRYYRGLYARDRLPYRLTASGAFAPSRPAHLVCFFQKLGLSRFRLFVDLGSGDGIAACVAGLFTRAVGIESDPELAARAARAARDLGLRGRVSFLCADFFTQRIRTADCLYIYPDKPLYNLEKALAGWRGTLLAYGPHFPPKRFCRVDKLRCGRETLAAYEAR